MQYAMIVNRKTGKPVSGTDFRYTPAHQIYADEWHPPMLVPLDSAHINYVMRHRDMSTKSFSIVPVELRRAETSDDS